MPTSPTLAITSASQSRADRVRSGLLVVFVVGLGVSITLAQASLLLLAGLWVYRLVAGQRRVDPLPLAWPVLAWTVVSIAAALAADQPLESLVRARSLWQIAAFYVVVDAVRDAREARRFLSRLLIVIGLVSIVSLLQVTLCPALGPWEDLLGRVARKCERAHGFFSIYMTLAGVLSLVLVSVLPLLVVERRVLSSWRSAAWVLGLLAFGATLVRGAWLPFAVVVAALVYLLQQRLLGVVIAIMVCGVLLTPSVRQRVLSIGDPTDRTAGERLVMWQTGIAMAWDHPLTGVGPGQVKRMYPRYASPESGSRTPGHLHNTPLQILVERGIPGLVAWTALFGAFFLHAGRQLCRLGREQRLERAVVTGAVAAIAAFLGAGLTEYNFGDSEVVLVAYCVMALPFTVGREAPA